MIGTMEDWQPLDVCVCSGNSNSKELGEWNFDNERDNESLHELVDDQAEIGWKIVFKGHMAKEWEVLQGRYYDTLDLPECQEYKTGAWWMANLI